MKDTGGKRVQREFPVIVDDRMSRIGTALKADDYVSGIGEHIRDLTFSLISPVCAYDCFYHLATSSI